MSTAQSPHVSGHDALYQRGFFLVVFGATAFYGPSPDLNWEWRIPLVTEIFWDVYEMPGQDLQGLVSTCNPFGRFVDSYG